VPYEYYIYDNHPNTYAAYELARTAPYLGKWYPARQVIHVYRKYRAGQLRGATELGAALPMSAVIRRYTLATLTSAEVAASISLWLETDGMPEEQPEILDQSTFPLFRNQVIAAPYRWKIHQLRAEQPVDTYDKFLRAIITQMGRSIGMPAALSYGDSSEYNMASGRLDYQDYIRGIGTERRLYLELQCLEKIFYAWLALYLTRGDRAPMLREDIRISALRANYPHIWTYSPIHHSDPEKQANADVAKYNAGHITLFDILHEQNKDPEQHFEELEEQTKRLSKIGMPAPGMMPGMPTAGQSGGPSNGQAKTNGQATSSQTD
jgi:capsid protein